MSQRRRASAAREHRPLRPPSPSWVEVDLTALRHNVRQVKHLLGPRCRVWAVVKADAYGHGAIRAAEAVLEAGASGLAVSCFVEAAQLRRAGIRAPILLLGSGDFRRVREVVRLDLIQTACDPDLARVLSQTAQRLGKAARLHLKIDTGMGRFGLAPEQAVVFAQLIRGLPGLRLEGVFSHLATAEEADPGYARLQFQRFRGALDALAAVGVDHGVRHLANSAATLRFPEMRLDGVRTGLLIYGIRPDAPGLAPIDLHPALTWKTRIAFLQRLPAGSPISYGRTYVTKRETLVGVLPVGYADGYPRHASNRAHVLVQGTACPVTGVVCMDHTMIDATPAGDPKVGEEVVLIGRQGNAEITANQLAEWADTVVHEATTLIGPRVKRVYPDRGERLASQPDPEG